MKVAGIAVSSNTLTLVISRDDQAGKPREFKNTPQGHAALLRVLCKAQVSCVCLEATGLYHLDLILALDDAGFELMVINPKAAKRFPKAMQTRKNRCRRCHRPGRVRPPHALRALATP